jgi:hypothetical protein
MDVKSAFLNGHIKEEVYVGNHWALKIKNILPMYTSSIRRSMGLSKLLEHGMNVLGIFSPKTVLRLVKPILLSSLERLTRIYSFAKFMSMT